MTAVFERLEEVATAGPAVATILDALGTVLDPELDEPITDLNFVRSIHVDDAGVSVHLRLPTSFCSPNFAYLMASDAQDALERVEGIGEVHVFLDDHHDSDKINAGLAAAAGYKGTFGEEAEDSLDELRDIFIVKAHTAAIERSLSEMLALGLTTVEHIGEVLLRDLPPGLKRGALMRRRANLGLSLCRNSRVLVGDDGERLPDDQIPLRLRFARSVRISMEGNAHFCRGLLATRYADDAECDGTSGPLITDTRSTTTRSKGTQP
ncbi:DUF59 domain-containing protein [Gordonia amarae]|uniref:MIP18 family-like domain-containing protein n=2 Tax=Gordonia amarae TaxID=36821 RepID=G7GRP1_9ACTN|nr:iron-sulfur cluster assembly protein [Gordonia amarae]MCS3877036.1 metal-sulfur cluster biosynthetic enzyme [Gordonia amarae]QHN15850.1 DUF59 domain-containing protein [Gordonia amarae]QHN20418.1 DUF59 domain-containing protein [Gordonia amarae]QHN29270.1 DUF59 domain-containing protein [Gordonia amarae]QHN38048.1 DUF59 domain-containing protein [Gordonia amarae]